MSWDLSQDFILLQSTMCERSPNHHVDKLSPTGGFSPLVRCFCRRSMRCTSQIEMIDVGMARGFKPAVIAEGFTL